MDVNEYLSRAIGLIALITFLVIGVHQAIVHSNLDVIGSMWFVILIMIAFVTIGQFVKPDSPALFILGVAAFAFAAWAALMYFGQSFQLNLFAQLF